MYVKMLIGAHAGEIMDVKPSYAWDLIASRKALDCRTIPETPPPAAAPVRAPEAANQPTTAVTRKKVTARRR